MNNYCPPTAATSNPAAQGGTNDSITPRVSDVLCGGTNHHIGNNHWRALVNANKQLYLTIPKKQKGLVAKSIVHAIRSQAPPGRFLQKSEDGTWHDIGDRRACEKTSQALREGASDIRTEMRDENTNGLGPAMRPGQILPNRLIAFDYERVHAMDEDEHDHAVYTGQDGVVSKDKKGYRMKTKPNTESVLPHPEWVPQVSMSELSMMQAFQQFQAGLLLHQRQEQQGQKGVPTSITAPNALTVAPIHVPGNTLPARTALSPLPVQPNTSEVASAAPASTPATISQTAPVRPPPSAAPQANVESRNGVGVALHAQPPLDLQQHMLHTAGQPIQSDGTNTFLHHRALIQQQQFPQQSFLGERSAPYLQNFHATPYDFMRKKLLVARQKAALTEARLQNLQQIHNLQQQHAYHQQALQVGGASLGHQHAFNGTAVASLGQNHYALNSMNAAVGGQQHLLNGTSAPTGSGQHALLPSNGTTSNAAFGGAPRSALPRSDLKNSESTASDFFLGATRGDSLNSEGLMNLRRRIEASALSGLAPTDLNNTESISSLPPELLQLVRQESLSPEDLINSRNKMEASAKGAVPATTLNNTDSVSSLPPELWAIMTRRDSRNLDDTLNSAAKLEALGGCGDAMNRPGNAGSANLLHPTTLAHLRTAEMWDQQRKHLANLAAPPEFAGFGVVDTFGSGPDATLEPTELGRQSSLDHLLRAAEMASEDDEEFDEDVDSKKQKEDVKPRAASNPAWEYLKLASQKHLKPGKNDSSLMDDSDDDIPKVVTHPQADTKPAASSKRKHPAWDNMKKFAKQGKKLKPGMEESSPTKKAELECNTESPSSSKRKHQQKKDGTTPKQSSMKLLGDQKCHISSAGKSLSSTQSTLSTHPADSAASTIPRDNMRHALTQLTAVSRSCHPARPHAGPSIAATQDILPLQETAFLAGNSLTLSEVSWGRDVSFGGPKFAVKAYDDGQFDDPEDED